MFSSHSVLTLSCVIVERQADDRSSELLHGMDLEKADEERKAISSKPLELVEEQASNTPQNYNLRKSLAWDSPFFTSGGKSR